MDNFDFDYELEKQYHPENFMTEEEIEAEEKENDYNLEVRNAILERIKI